MTNHYIELEWFRTTIQRLTFAYQLPLTTLYEFSFRCKRPDYAEIVGLPPEENTTGFKRYGRILERVCTKTYSKNTPTFLLSKPKIYDDFLFECQKKIYNASSNVIGYQPIEKVLPISLIKSAVVLDNANPDYDTIAKEYPYYIPEKRDGVTFLEFVLFLNFDLVVNRRALKTINNPLIDTNSEKLAQKMVDKMIRNLWTSEMFEIYVHAFFDVLDMVEYKLKNPLAEQNVKEIWLPQYYLQRKDCFRALKTHIAEEKKHKSKKYDRTQIDNIVSKGNAYEIMRIDNILDNYGALEYIGIIFAMAFQMLLKNEEEIKDFEGTKEYVLAKEYANIIKEYIYNTINEVETILNRIYIDNDSPLRREK